ncbi:hypothetical protein BD289DRAFT_454528 [Coniella lustricola]|uniref:N-acetyltransferase domain-containing protein n=1 Tax=Coniella lustricola TaxID=2025994 RepID=A0A2T3A365_9PEZI|nr:hypothetical protein BD289DRAFT_454528 [Coniella lustricola]
MSTSTSTPDGITISLITDPADLAATYDIAAAAFGIQVDDAVWKALRPDWSHPLARAHLIARDTRGFHKSTAPASANPRTGLPPTIYLKATVTDASTNHVPTIAGVAIWSQLSFVDGWGATPSADLPGADAILVEGIQPDAETAARKIKLAKQVFASLMARRMEVIREIAREDEGSGKRRENPGVFALDLCAVDPKFQKRGLASRLVQYGLDEAREKREDIEAVVEGSVMGRSVYARLGFKPVAEVEYNVDEELLNGTTLPSNLFMRTRP